MTLSILILLYGVGVLLKQHRKCSDTFPAKTAASRLQWHFVEFTEKATSQMKRQVHRKSPHRSNNMCFATATDLAPFFLKLSLQPSLVCKVSWTESRQGAFEELRVNIIQTGQWTQQAYEYGTSYTSLSLTLPFPRFPCIVTRRRNNTHTTQNAPKLSLSSSTKQSVLAYSWRFYWSLLVPSRDV